MDPTGLDSSVTTTHTLTDVAAGSYSVSVMAENENGMSQEMTAPFVVQGMHVCINEPAVCVYFELGSIQVCGLCCMRLLFCTFWYTSGICQECVYMY